MADTPPPACQRDIDTTPHDYSVPVAKEAIFVPEIGTWRTVVWALACSGCGRVTRLPWEAMSSPFGDFKIAEPADARAHAEERAVA